MGKQLHKRLSKEFVEEVLEAFNSGRITEAKACELLGIKRTRLYELRIPLLGQRQTVILTQDDYSRKVEERISH